MAAHNIKNPLSDKWDLDMDWDMDWDMDFDWNIPDILIPVQSENVARKTTASDVADKGKKAK